MNLNASYTLTNALPSGVNRGKIVGSTGQPSSSMIGNVERESYIKNLKVYSSVTGFGEILPKCQYFKSLYSSVYLTFGKILSLLWKFFYMLIGTFSLLQMGK